MKILAIIPARGGSKGVPGKNIKPLAGIPLIGWSLMAAHDATCFDEIVVSSDDDAILEVAASFSIGSNLKRPEHLATDASRSIDAVKHVVEHYRSQGRDFDAVCLLQPTSPLRVPGFIGSCVDRFIAKQADGLFSALEVPHEFNPHWTFEEDADGYLHIATGEQEIISRRQALPKAYFRDGAVYLTRTNVIMEQDSLYGAKKTFMLSDPQWYVNIDTPADWEKAEPLAQRYLSIHPLKKS